MLISLLQGEITQDDYINYNNIRINFKRLPKYIYGFIYSYRDINLITINKNLSDKKKDETILHEFAHLELRHLDDFLLEFKIEQLEDEADEYIAYLQKIIDFKHKN